MLFQLKQLTILFILGLANVSLCASDYAEIGLPITEVFDSFSHKGGTQSWSLIQKDNGLIYSGANTGLNEWDGHQWQIYKTPNKSRIRALTIWEDGNIYVGTSNDLGFYTANQSGVLQYHSLLEDWSFDEKQFGEIWSVASNKHGVMFLSSDYLYFWNGKTIHEVAGAATGTHRIFAVGNSFYFKPNDDVNLYQITFQPDLKVSQTGIALDKSTVIRSIFTNNNKKLTVFTSKNGSYEIEASQIKQSFPFKDFKQDVTVYNAIQASDGYYYVTTLYHGLFILDEFFKLVKNYTEKDGLNTNTLLSIMEDYQGTIWISGVPVIIRMVPPHHYSHYQNDSNAQDSESIALINHKVTVSGDSIHQLEISDNPLEPAYFKRITPDRIRTWKVVGFKQQLLYAGQGGVFSLELDTAGNWINHHNLLAVEFAKSIAVDSTTNVVFAATDIGLYRLNYAQNQWQKSLVPGTVDDLHYIAIDQGIVWVGTDSQELYRIENAPYDELENKVRKFIDTDGLGPNNVIPFTLSSGVVIGTNDGLMQYNEDQQLSFLTEMPKIFHSKDMDVFRLLEDQERNRLWYRINNKTGYVNKDQNDQWQTHEGVFNYFNDSGYKGFVKTAPDTLWFSMANGEIYRANIDAIENIPAPGKLNIRQIKDLDTNELVFGGTGKPQLPVLQQNNNSIRISYALADNSILNSKNEQLIQYRQRLVGSGKTKFSQWSNENQKDFTSLPGGHYSFEVEAKDSWGRITSDSFSFEVLPVWYLSKTAWFIYVFLIISLMLLSAWLSQKWRTKKLKLRNLKLEQLVDMRTAEVTAKAAQLEQLQILKDRFFSNVSHEFRTPLTLAIAPLESVLIDHPNLDTDLKAPITSALNNSKKMLDLVGLVLDMNRLESGSFPLRVSEHDVSDLITNNCTRFQPLAHQNHQHISVKNVETPVLLYFDLDQLDRCLSNLISNAIKYSGKNSQIVVSLINTKEQVGIQVADNGQGVAVDLEDKIFNRFTQGKTSEQLNMPGTGIGLALVKELMSLQHGSVQLVNRVGSGCQFTLWLKRGKAHFKPTEIIAPTTQPRGMQPLSHQDLEAANIQTQSPNHQAHDMTTILVVDDHTELREFIVSRLAANYHILQAADGKQGYDMAVAQLPDLIISDVMMPIMNGFDLTEKIKSNELTQMIPIILLTAKSTKRETVEGLKTGADDYLTKPFDTSELVTRVDGLINNRKLVRAAIKLELSKQLKPLKEKDSFSKKLNHEILTHLSEPNFTVEALAESMSMSRITLNRKCQKLSQKSPSQLITETRLQHALSLLKESNYSISEIAYGTGYESLAYFSRTFKKHYGKSPSQLRSAN